MANCFVRKCVAYNYMPSALHAKWLASQITYMRIYFPSGSAYQRSYVPSELVTCREAVHGKYNMPRGCAWQVTLHMHEGQLHSAKAEAISELEALQSQLGLLQRKVEAQVLARESELADLARERDQKAAAAEAATLELQASLCAVRD
ncbi:MAG: hypothetical protein SGPRY_009676, partial [Prymnesium sp.]